MNVEVVAAVLLMLDFIFMVRVQLDVSGALNFLRQKMNEKILLHDAVIQLHDIARLVEDLIGDGSLSADIRSTADRLNVLINPLTLENVNE